MRMLMTIGGNGLGLGGDEEVVWSGDGLNQCGRRADATDALEAPVSRRLSRWRFQRQHGRSGQRMALNVDFVDGGAERDSVAVMNEPFCEGDGSLRQTVAMVAK